MSQLQPIVSKLLTNVLQGYVPSGFISEMILPQLNVVQQGGKIAKRGLSHLRIETSLMGGKGMARRVEVRTYNSDTYYIMPYGLEEVLTPEEYKNVEKPFDLEKDTVMALQMALYLGKEVGLATSLRSTSIITQNTTLSGTSQWNDFANSTPLVDILTAKKVVRAASGAKVDTAIADADVWDTLRYHPTLVRSLGYADNRAGQLTDADLAKALNVKRILSADVLYNSAKEGQADSLTSVWGKDVILAACPETAGIDQKSLGYRVQFAGDSSRKVYKQPVVNPPESNSIIVKDSYDQVLTDVKCAYLIKTAIA